MEYLKNGWKKGSAYKKVAMNNGIKNIWVDSSNVKSYELNGWKKGWKK